MKKISIIIAIIFSVIRLHAQNNECDVQFSMYKEFLKVEAYEESLESYRNVLNNCRKYRKAVYIDGIKIYKAMIAKTEDETQINGYLDTLKLIYTRRIEDYGEESNVLSRCAMDVLKFRKSDTTSVEAYHLFQRSIAASPQDPEISALSMYFQLAVSLSQQGKISHKELFNVLTPNIITTYRNRKTKPESYSEQVNKVIGVTQSILFKIPNISQEFDTLFLQNYQLPTDNDELLYLTNTMTDLSAENNQLFSQAAEKLYAQNPTPQAAVAIARYNKKQKNYDKSAQFYAEAIKSETDSKLLSTYLYEAATVANYQNKYSEAVSLAKKSVKANSQNGAPLILISAIYYANAHSITNDSFERGKIYWLAADYAQKAKSVDMLLSDEARSLIAKCKPFFPNKEDAFMHSVKQGDVVKVEVYGVETTTARF